MVSRKTIESIEDFHKREREWYAENREHILQRLKKRRDEKAIKSTKGKLVEHHIKYKEIHGVDETIWMPFGEHIQLHRRLRAEGKCNIPTQELNRISHLAKNRTGKVKARRHRIEFTDTVGKYIQLSEEIIYDCITGHVGYRARFRLNHISKNGRLLQFEEHQ